MTVYPKAKGGGQGYIEVPVNWEFSTRWTFENGYIQTTNKSCNLAYFSLVSPVAQWHFNENAGGTTADVSGNSYTGTLSGIGWGTAKLGASSVATTANTHKVQCTNAALLRFNYNSPFSISFWLYVPLSLTGAGQLVGKSDASENGYHINLDSAGKLSIQIRNAYPTHLVQITAIGDDLRTAGWHHIVWINSGSGTAAGQTFYVDNVVKTGTVAFDNLGSNSILNSSQFTVGSDNDYNDAAYPVKIDEVVVFSSAISSTLVATMWNSGNGTEVVSADGYSTAAGYYAKTSTTGQLNTANFTGIYGIKTAEVTPANTQVRYLISVDGGTTYKAWNGATWVTVTLANMHVDGMSKTILEALTDFTGIFAAGTLDIAAGLKTTDNTVTSQVNQLLVRLLP